MYTGLGLDKKSNRTETDSVSVFNAYEENFTLLDPCVELFLEFVLYIIISPPMRNNQAPHALRSVKALTGHHIIASIFI
jgi:hypothetical protein